MNDRVMKYTLSEKERACTPSATSAMTRLSWSGTRISMTPMMFTLALSSKSSPPFNTEEPFKSHPTLFHCHNNCNSFSKPFMLKSYIFFSIKPVKTPFNLLHCIDIYSRKRKKEKIIFIINCSLAS